MPLIAKDSIVWSDCVTIDALILCSHAAKRILSPTNYHHLNTVIFDMDGLLIDSEPMWEEAGRETLESYGVIMSTPEYHTTTGLRTREWIEWWFTYFGIDLKHSREAEDLIHQKAIEKIGVDAMAMPGLDHILSFFADRGFRIGLATSSPLALVDVVVDKLNIRRRIHAFASAENLLYGKPHPEVYLNCAKALDTSPVECICFEDSVNGMIAAKAARMKCVVIPSVAAAGDKRFGLADLMLRSLLDFDEQHLRVLKPE